MILQFNYIPYPLWRRRMPGWLTPLARQVLPRVYPLHYDERPPTSRAEVMQYLTQWKLFPDLQSVSKHTGTGTLIRVETAAHDTPRAAQGTIRLPAQWEAMERVLVTFPVLYPPLWELHARMIEAITPVAEVNILIPAPAWAHAIHWYLAEHTQLDFTRVRFLHLPTDDMWVRDYGPIVGLDKDGCQSVVYANFDPLPNYPQERDAAMAARWAAHEDLPARFLDLHIEGGNLWSDGQGTLITSEQVFIANPFVTRPELERRLRHVFEYDKLIVLPRLRSEETGHIDLVIKLANATTVLVSAPQLFYNSMRLHNTIRMLKATTNARGENYEIVPLPHLQPYLNWGVYPIWRSYTNALTVNGRVLVPTFRVEEDEQALRAYERAMPGYQVIPIDCSVVAHGGGAVHCLTKEIPRAQPIR